MPLAVLSLRESSFVDWRPVDALGVWECHGDVVGASGHFTVTVAAPQGATAAASGQRCLHEPLLELDVDDVKVADTSRQQEIAPRRNKVQQARETVINRIAGEVLAFANQVNILISSEGGCQKFTRRVRDSTGPFGFENNF